MAGDWIACSKDLPKKVEVVSIASATGRSRREVVAVLLEFWIWADGETINGRLPGISVEHLAAVIEGTDHRFWSAVVQAGWLRDEPGGLLIPNFGKWMGNSAKRRLRDAKRKKHVRKMSASQADKMKTIGEERTGKEKTEKKNSSPPLSPSLDTTEFRRAWTDWSEHRRQKRKPLTEKAVGSQLKFLEGLGLSRAIATIDYTIRQGWEGLYEPKEDQHGNARSGPHLGSPARIRANDEKLRAYDAKTIRIGGTPPEAGLHSGPPAEASCNGRA